MLARSTIVAFLVLAGAAPALSQTAPTPTDYFLVPVRSRWIQWQYEVYADGSGDANLMTVSAARLASSSSGTRSARFTNYLGTGERFVVHRDAQGEVADQSAGTHPWYFFEQGPGQIRPSELERNTHPGENIGCEFVSGMACITQPFVFESCMRVDYFNMGPVAGGGVGITTEYFAPGIGLVGRDFMDPSGALMHMRLENLRTSAGFALAGDRPLQTRLSQASTPGTGTNGGDQLTLTLHIAAPRGQTFTCDEPNEPVTFFLVNDEGWNPVKVSARYLSPDPTITIDEQGVDYTVTIDKPSFDEGTWLIAAQTNLTPGALVATIPY